MATKRKASAPARGNGGSFAAPPPTTGDLINRLSEERLMLYQQGSGHPLPREIRARLVEIVRELDRLWEARRHELASAPFPLQAPPAPAETKTRARGHRQVA